jgi:hypothetical protein
VPAAGDQPAERRLFRRSRVDVERLRVELLGEREDVRLAHGHGTDLDRAADLEVLEPAHRP